MNVLLIFTFCYTYLNIEIIYNIGTKTVLYLVCNRHNDFVVVQNGKAEQPVPTRTANVENKKLVLHVQLMCESLSLKTPVSLLANEFDVRSVLHRQVSLAAVNQMYVFHEAMNGYNNLKIP